MSILRDCYRCFGLGVDIIDSSGSVNRFCALESASICGSTNTEEKSGSKLIDTHNTIFNMGGSFWIVAMLSMTSPSALVQSLSLKRTCDITHADSTIRCVTAQIIYAKKICPNYLPGNSQSNDILSLKLKSNTYMGEDGEFNMRD
ncbi:hypothetical protein B9Z19DRAFT_1060421 [Tuber borchii]|uniref:Uncharacterized protein n=1 Tax=Tuber borchii TaxID=42251 RepID=A0A2T7A8V0_TUBBO|nr:hypothetical protein B9Z19DRAFT_1060421 [Tuber borchii]